MTFEEFQANVQGWSKERGIYEHSTALAQALKAVSEVGELADATIKNDIAELKDAIGDVAVCLVNVAYMDNYELDCEYILAPVVTGCTPYETAALGSNQICRMVSEIARFGKVRGWSLNASMCALNAIAQTSDLDFLDCCESAWHEIKDRKGHMVAGGAFVKELD